MKFTMKMAVCVLLASILFGSCDTFKDDESDNYVEVPKNLEGVWQLTTVSRNGVDITNLMDFSKFRLDLKEDGSYTIDNYLPFVVRKDGAWRVDDPSYPFQLLFKEEGAQSEVNAELKYPIVNGVRTLSILLSPGCGSNTYTYVFVKNENN